MVIKVIAVKIERRRTIDIRFRYWKRIWEERVEAW